MEIAFVLIGLILLLVLVSWDHDNLAEKAKVAVHRSSKRQGVNPRAKATWGSLTIAALACAGLAFALYFQPPKPPFTGRGSAIWTVVHGLLGTYAAAIIAAAFCVALLTAALVVRARAEPPKQ